MSAQNTAVIRIEGRILSVGGSQIEVDVSSAGDGSHVLTFPAQRGQEEWAGARLYAPVLLEVVIKS